MTIAFCEIVLTKIYISIYISTPYLIVEPLLNLSERTSTCTVQYKRSFSDDDDDDDADLTGCFQGRMQRRLVTVDR